MSQAPEVDVAAWQSPRFVAGSDGGHYESWFLRANHPVEPRAFWIRYTVFSPKGRSSGGLGELWAIYFDGTGSSGSTHIQVGKRELPLADCAFAPQGLDISLGDSHLSPGKLTGSVLSPQSLSWDLRYQGGTAPLLFLPQSYYTRAIPKAKAVTTRPFAHFSGSMEVAGQTIRVDDWIGSENHNWGSKHTDTYAWGQVAGFDNAPEVFLEVISARLKFGPLWTPQLTILVVRLGDEEIRLNTIRQGFKANARREGFDWMFDSTAPGIHIRGRIWAHRDAFVGLTYYNPPGGSHTCLNSKIASCELTITREGKAPTSFVTKSRSAFEILTDDKDHGVSVAV